MGRQATYTVPLLAWLIAAMCPSAFADTAPKSNTPDLVWISALEVRLTSDTTVIDSAWQKLDNMPIMKTECRPSYPEGAMLKGLEADVWVQAIVGTDGLVHRAKITKPSAHGLEPGFELCALNAAMGNIFDPAMKEGKPIAVWVTYPVSFRLK